MPPKQPPKCTHSMLSFSPSPHAERAGYKYPTSAQRMAAEDSQGIKNHREEQEGKGSTFPSPLVLPEDELAIDPKPELQSLRSWLRGKYRNKVTPERRTIYFAGPPDFESGVEEFQKWSQPQQKATKSRNVPFPETEDVRSYLEAFYHGMPVKMLPGPRLSFTTDVEEEPVPSVPSGRRKQHSKTPPASPTLWLKIHSSSSAIGIRSRATPNNAFSHQLNLNDLLDTAMAILPSDAYALLLLVEQDMFEDAEDDFVCGRAYGGSRIAVVSAARYLPLLDAKQGIERAHAWPASHCVNYMRACCEAVQDEDDDDEDGNGKLGKFEIPVAENERDGISPMYAALAAHNSLPSLSRTASTATLYGLWLGRVCRTASHELGHCFGIDHCAYYACSMQGTSSIVEDSRQPPYLCPVDLAKVLAATGASAGDRYRALLGFCERFGDVQLFAAYGAWMKRRLVDVGDGA